MLMGEGHFLRDLRRLVYAHVLTNGGEKYVIAHMHTLLHTVELGPLDYTDEDHVAFAWDGDEFHPRAEEDECA